MKGMSRYLLGVVTQSRREGSPTQCPIFNHSIECTRALVEFYICTWYKSHDDATLSYMDHAYHRFHTFKDVFIPGQTRNTAKVKAIALRTELLKKWKVDEKTNAETWTPSKKRREMNVWRDYMRRKIDDSKALGADFTFQLSTWCLIGLNRFLDMEPCNSIVPRDTNKHMKQTSMTFGTPPIKISTTCHKWSPCSVAFSASKSESSISKLSLSFGSIMLPPAKSSLLVLIWLPPYAPSHMRSPNSCRPKTTVMESILTLWTKTSEHYSTIHRMERTAWVLYSSMREFVKQKNCNKMDILDEQLLAMELCIYHGIKVQAEGLDGECISQMCRCTGSQMLGVSPLAEYM